MTYSLLLPRTDSHVQITPQAMCAKNRWAGYAGRDREGEQGRWALLAHLGHVVDAGSKDTAGRYSQSS